MVAVSFDVGAFVRPIKRMFVYSPVVIDQLWTSCTYIFAVLCSFSTSFCSSDVHVWKFTAEQWSSNFVIWVQITKCAVLGR